MDTNIYLIIDGSGSMSSIKHDVVKGINEFIDEQKADAKLQGDTVLLSLTSFDSSVHHVYDAEDISLINHVAVSDTFWGGGTALLDAIGRTLTKAEDNPAPKNLVVIYTDGKENQSHEFSHEDVTKLIEGLDQSGDWQFIYLGAELADFANNVDNSVFAFAGATLDSVNTSKGSATQSWSNVSATSNYYRGQAITGDPRGLLRAAKEDLGLNWDEVKEEENE